MIDTPTEDKIRDRAHALWVNAGSPAGDGRDFWHQAERELGEESGVDLSAENAEVKIPPLPAGTLAR